MESLTNIRKLQTEISSVGLGAVALTVPASKLSNDLGGHTETEKQNQEYFLAVVEPEIVDVTRDLFVSGFYGHAVGEAFKVVDKFVAEKSGLNDSGVKLMRKAFNEQNPLLWWSTRSTQSEKDEHEGYGHILAGVMLGVRNPTAHEINWIEDADEALDLIVMAQHLVRKIKSAAASP
jgi:uncharacterized protein (TIGR02391 family)